jgi:hypothetical protein
MAFFSKDKGAAMVLGVTPWLQPMAHSIPVFEMVILVSAESLHMHLKKKVYR